MKKLKEIAQQNMQPSAQNKFEPVAKQPVAQTTAPAKAPVQTTQQPTGDTPTEKSSLDNQIFTIKIRLGQMKSEPIVKLFQESLHRFDEKVKRGVQDRELIQSYLSPLLGNIESLKGQIEGLEIELKKLDDMTQIEATKESRMTLKSLVPEDIKSFKLSNPPVSFPKSGGKMKTISDPIDVPETGFAGRRKQNTGKQHIITPYDEMWEDEIKEEFDEWTCMEPKCHYKSAQRFTKCPKCGSREIENLG